MVGIRDEIYDKVVLHIRVGLQPTVALKENCSLASSLTACDTF
jgi:hypothetical protein